tara:strand:- start:4519 stop:5598 length:1080 start_codon:yes stop_codon:yes gene_type:complete
MYVAINLFSPKLRVRRFNLFLILFLIFYFIFLIIIFSQISIRNNTLTPFFASIQYLFAPLFWAIFFNKYKMHTENIFNFLLENFSKIGILMAFGAFFQYFISSNLFGLIQSDVYAPSDGIINPNVTLRAISFINSPQSLGLFLASIFTLRLFYLKSSFINVLYQCLIFFAGILTGSKAFVLFISAALFSSIINFKLKIWLYLISGLVCLYFFRIYLDIETLERFTQIGTRIFFLSEYGTFQIWMNFLNYPSSVFQELFGHGLGVLNTSAQNLYDYKILTGSAESFLVQLYFETGLVGLLTFLLFYILIVIKCFLNSYIKPVGYVLVGSLVIMIGTPAFFGFVNSFWMWGLLIYAHLWRK